MERMNFGLVERVIAAAAGQSRRRSPESPLESLWLEQATERFASGIGLALQVPVSTPGGEYRLDAVVSHPRRQSVGIELDGAEWHKPERDRRRDAAILAKGVVDPIIRIRGQDLFHHPDITWAMVARRIPWAFTPRMREVLERQIADIPEQFGPFVDKDYGATVYVPFAETGEPGPEVRLTFHSSGSFLIRRIQRLEAEAARDGSGVSAREMA